jgi:hypothetical protein
MHTKTSLCYSVVVVVVIVRSFDYCYMVGGGPTLSTSKLPTIRGNSAKAKPLNTINGKAMYKPTSKTPVRSRLAVVGINPPKLAAFLSSSVASQDFIFSSSVNFFSVVVVGGNSSVGGVSRISWPGSARSRSKKVGRAMTGVLDTRTDIEGDRKAPAGAAVDDNNRHSRRKSRSLGMLVV